MVRRLISLCIHHSNTTPPQSNPVESPLPPPLQRHSTNTTLLPRMISHTMLTANPALRQALVRARRPPTHNATTTTTTTTVLRQPITSRHAQSHQNQQQRHVSASTRKPAAAPAPAAAGRTVPSPAFNRDDAAANVHPLKPFRRPDMDHSFVGMTGGQIFHDMMLRQGVKTICEYFIPSLFSFKSTLAGVGVVDESRGYFVGGLYWEGLPLDIILPLCSLACSHPDHGDCEASGRQLDESSDNWGLTPDQFVVVSQRAIGNCILMGCQIKRIEALGTHICRAWHLNRTIGA